MEDEADGTVEMTYIIIITGGGGGGIIIIIIFISSSSRRRRSSLDNVYSTLPKEEEGEDIILCY